MRSLFSTKQLLLCLWLFAACSAGEVKENLVALFELSSQNNVLTATLQSKVGPLTIKNHISGASDVVLQSAQFCKLASPAETWRVQAGDTLKIFTVTR